jgi:hypothetical protein
VEDSLLGLKQDIGGRSQALLFSAGSWMPCTLAKRAALPAERSQVLRLEAGWFDQAKWTLVVRADGRELLRQAVNRETAPDHWLKLNVDLAPFKGKTIWLDVSNFSGESNGAYGWLSELAIGDQNQ